MTNERTPMKKAPRRKRCDLCGELKQPETVTRRENPYDREIHNETNMQNICGACYEQAQQDI